MTELPEWLKALSDPTRLRIVHLVSQRELCVCDITEVLQIPQAKISRHLAVLRNAGILSDRRHAQWVYYALADHSRTSLIRALSDLEFHQAPYTVDLKALELWLNQKRRHCL